MTGLTGMTGMTGMTGVTGMTGMTGVTEVIGMSIVTSCPWLLIFTLMDASALRLRSLGVIRCQSPWHGQACLRSESCVDVELENCIWNLFHKTSGPGNHVKRVVFRDRARENIVKRAVDAD